MNLADVLLAVKVLMKKPWNDPSVEMGSMIGLESDHVLADDKVCLPLLNVTVSC